MEGLKKKNLKKCTKCLVSREIKIKTLRFHFTPVRLVLISKITDNKYWQRSRGRWVITHGWWEHKLAQLLWKSVRKILKNINLPYGLVIPFFGLCPKIWASDFTDNCSAIFTGTLFTITRKLEQPKYPSIVEWLMKMCYIHTMEFNSVQRKMKE